jgi:hypothetical protein
MPSHPPMVFLRRDGTVLGNRGWVLSTWANQEISRLTMTLATEHRPYILAVAAAVRGEPSAVFTTMEDDDLFIDPVPTMRIGQQPPVLPVHIENSEHVRGRWERHQLVAEDYKRNRYLMSLTNDALSRRTEDVFSNMFWITEDGKTGLDIRNPQFQYWSDLNSELQQEYLFRGTLLKDCYSLFRRENFPQSVFATNVRGKGLISAPPSLRQGFLFRYSKKQFLERLLRRGTLCLNPGSGYKDPSLNASVRDDELSAEILFDPFLMLRNEQPSRLRRAKVTSRTDYYALCMSSRFGNRLLLDFEAEACLIIRDPQAFLQRIKAAAVDRLPEWNIELNKVEYFDPLRANPTQVDLTWSKHFRFAYQDEVRLACVPPNPIAKLAPVLLEIGNLEDIAEIVYPTMKGKEPIA